MGGGVCGELRPQQVKLYSGAEFRGIWSSGLTKCPGKWSQGVFRTEGCEENSNIRINSPSDLQSWGIMRNVGESWKNFPCRGPDFHGVPLHPHGGGFRSTRGLQADRPSWPTNNNSGKPVVIYSVPMEIEAATSAQGKGLGTNSRKDKSFEN